MEKIIALIPARYQSSRFPGKPLALINGKPMIQWVYETVDKVQGINATYVATDDERIQKCVNDFQGRCLMTSPKHECGSDRLAECVDILQLDDNDIVLNIQGDEPMIRGEMVQELMSTIMDKETIMGTLKERITEPQDINNPNIVKVVTDINDNALYFSRYAVPFNRNNNDIQYYRHVGVYAYRAFFLKKYTKWDKSQLEISESLEQLRVLENGFKIKVKETKYSSIGVDTEEQLELVEHMMECQ